MKFMQKLAVAASIVGGTLAFTPVVSSAQTIQLELGGRQPRVLLRQEEIRPAPRPIRGCSTDRALDKAERMGIRRARIESDGRRFVEVSGRRRGDRVLVVFANERGCPVIERAASRRDRDWSRRD
jgi:hypothetical protein